MKKFFGAKLTPENKKYFQSLAQSRASLEQMKIGLVAAIVGSIVVNLFYQFSVYANAPEFREISFTLLALVIISLVIGCLGFFETLIYKHQVPASSLLSLHILSLVSILAGLGYLLAIYRGPNIVASASIRYLYYGIIVMVVIISIVINIGVLNRRLIQGFSEKRVMKNFLAVSQSYRSKQFWVIFAVIIVSSFFAPVEHFMNIIGLFSMIVLPVVFANPLIEFTYLAYLKSKDRSYWENLPYKKSKRKINKKKLIISLVKWLYVLLSFGLIIKFGEIYAETGAPIPIKILSYLFVFSWLALFMIWILKKVKTYGKKRKKKR